MLKKNPKTLHVNILYLYFTVTEHLKRPVTFRKSVREFSMKFDVYSKSPHEMFLVFLCDLLIRLVPNYDVCVRHYSCIVFTCIYRETQQVANDFDFKYKPVTILITITILIYITPPLKLHNNGPININVKRCCSGMVSPLFLSQLGIKPIRF